MRFSFIYFLISVTLFVVEVFIAIYGDGWIRSYLGDVLVVILIYTSIKSVFNVKFMPTALGVLAFSFLVEFAQYFKLVHLLGLQKNKIAVIIIGNTFHWLDLVSYVVGWLIIVIIEKSVNS